MKLQCSATNIEHRIKVPLGLLETIILPTRPQRCPKIFEQTKEGSHSCEKEMLFSNENPMVAVKCCLSFFLSFHAWNKWYVVFEWDERCIEPMNREKLRFPQVFISQTKPLPLNQKAFRMESVTNSVCSQKFHLWLHSERHKFLMQFCRQWCCGVTSPSSHDLSVSDWFFLLWKVFSSGGRSSDISRLVPPGETLDLICTTRPEGDAQTNFCCWCDLSARKREFEMETSVWQQGMGWKKYWLVFFPVFILHWQARFLGSQKSASATVQVQVKAESRNPPDKYFFIAVSFHLVLGISARTLDAFSA